MKSLTLTINHNNTISAGFEKDTVVSTLLALHGARIPMDDEAMQAWALTHGWSGKNPQRLAKYVQDINAGKRPRSSRVLCGLHRPSPTTRRGSGVIWEWILEH